MKLMFLLLFAVPAAASTRTLTMDEFLRLAVRNDTQFEEILIAELALKHRQDLRLPARDFVLSVREELSASLDIDENDDKTTAGLSKLFPLAGTELDASYTLTPPASRPNHDAAALTFALAQPIAENAFGRSTRLLRKIVGLETDVARYQIVEAYEDYLAAVQGFYLDWYEAYENLQIGRSSYEENLKLLENMRQRSNARIAKTIDVNKIELQVLGKKEKLVDLEEAYVSRLNLVQRVLRHKSAETLVPAAPPPPAPLTGSFDEMYARFRGDSRTYRTLRLLEDKSSLEVSREADALLPSISLLFEYERRGEKPGIEKPENKAMAGVSIEFPFFTDQQGKAAHEIAKVERRRTELATQNTHERLRADILNLHLRMERETRLEEITDTKIRLAENVLKDESENYTYAKASLNDYISAVNVLDANRFSRIQHGVLRRKLRIEWSRITDRLVTEDVLRAPAR
ncbi:MAG: TolC family protein [Elusimicrobiota bacterium]